REVTGVGPERPGIAGVGKLGHMDKRMAERLDLEVEVLDDHWATDPVEDTIALLVIGAGAYALLAHERGLHYLSPGRMEGRDGRRTGQREVVRIEVFPASGAAVLDRETVRAEVRPLEDVQGRLLSRPRFEVLLSHRPSLTTLR